MRSMIPSVLCAVLVACAADPPAARPRTPPGAAGAPAPPPRSTELGDGVGTADFATSCVAAEKDEINRAVALLHSFFYDEARRRFQAIGVRDPACAMAEWGVAMTHWHPIWQAPRADEVAAGLDAVRRARALAPGTPRERAYVEAIEAFYVAKAGSTEPASQSCHGVIASDHVAGALAYEAKMQDLVARFPDDVEAKVFYALALLATHPPADATLERPLRAARILEDLSPAHPDHPGIAHYLIHAYDYPSVAERGLPAARAYARMAPWVPHALHMPSHIFTRLGMWPDAVAANLSAAEAARRYEARFHPGAHAAEELHALDYLTYAYLQTGEDAKAKAILDYIATVDRTNPAADLVAGYPFGAIPARYALERRRWVEAAGLAVPRLAESLPFVEANVVYARAIGSARSGDATGARAAAARLTTLRDAVQDPKYLFFRRQIDVQRAASEAWVLHASGAATEARAALRAAADAEDALGKHPVTPGSILPVREQLGDLLLEQGDAAGALAEYQRSLAATPGRLLGLYGAGRAADRAGDAVRARAYFEKVVAVAGASTAREEVAEARAWLEKRSR